jgi:hypothetical protein
MDNEMLLSMCDETLMLNAFFPWWIKSM